VTEASDVARVEVASAADRSGRPFEARASLVFKVVAAFGLIVGGAVLLTAGGDPVDASAVLALGAATGCAGLEIIEARGLDQRRPWALAAARPMLAVLVATGLLSSLVALGESRLELPIAAVLAFWALLGVAIARVPPRDRRSNGMVVAFVALTVVTMGAHSVIGPGGVLDVRKADLVDSIDVECGDPASAPPHALSIVYAWHWARTGLPASGLDSVVIAWSGADDVGASLYALAATPPTGSGVYAGLSGGPSSDLAMTFAQGYQGSWEWGIALDEQHLQPGRIEVELQRSAAPPHAGSLTVTADYIHLGVWQRQVEATCTW
jgi:hypothetical protein